MLIRGNKYKVLCVNINMKTYNSKNNKTKDTIKNLLTNLIKKF